MLHTILLRISMKIFLIEQVRMKPLQVTIGLKKIVVILK